MHYVETDDGQIQADFAHRVGQASIEQASAEAGIRGSQTQLDI